MAAEIAAYTQGQNTRHARDAFRGSQQPRDSRGNPRLRGYSGAVPNAPDYLKAGDPLAEFLEDFPTVSREQAVAALEQAKDALFARAHSS